MNIYVPTCPEGERSPTRPTRWGSWNPTHQSPWTNHHRTLWSPHDYMRCSLSSRTGLFYVGINEYHFFRIMIARYKWFVHATLELGSSWTYPHGDTRYYKSIGRQLNHLSSWWLVLVSTDAGCCSTPSSRCSDSSGMFWTHSGHSVSVWGFNENLAPWFLGIYKINQKAKKPIIELEIYIRYTALQIRFSLILKHHHILTQFDGDLLSIVVQQEVHPWFDCRILVLLEDQFGVQIILSLIRKDLHLINPMNRATKAVLLRLQRLLLHILQHPDRVHLETRFVRYLQRCSWLHYGWLRLHLNLVRQEL